MPSKNRWDPELYEAQHSFVWQFGQELIDLLEVRPGDRILDVGCGTGQLTAEIERRGADVVGLDASPEMIGQARQHFPPAHHPRLRFVLADAASMNFLHEFDAVFSNAALHWILDTSAVASAIARALKPGGRLVLECGGRGNIAHIEAAIHSVFDTLLQVAVPASRTVFHSISSFTSILEANGLEVQTALLFDRPTKLDGERGMAQWLEQFAAYYFEGLPADTRDRAARAIVERLRPVLYRDGAWFADYRRLRITARKL